ncbi:MAG TPA: hypothetical protein VIR61_06595 [Sulfuricaulis sp.]
MLCWFRKKLKILGQGILALAGSLWLIAAATPCVAAQTVDHNPGSQQCPVHTKHNGTEHVVAPECCPVAAINCQIPQTGTPLTVAFGSFAVAPVLLTTLPVTIIRSDAARYQRHDFLAPDIPAPPLHIRHLTLLI